MRVFRDVGGVAHAVRVGAVERVTDVADAEAGDRPCCCLWVGGQPVYVLETFREVVDWIQGHGG